MRPLSPFYDTSYEIATESHRTWVVGIGAFCLDTPGRAEIEHVELVGASHLTLEGFGIGAGPAVLLDPGTLKGLLADAEGTGVEPLCSDSPTEDEITSLNIQVGVDPAHRSSFTSLVVEWGTGDRSGSQAIPVGAIFTV